MSNYAFDLFFNIFQSWKIEPLFLELQVAAMQRNLSVGVWLTMRRLSLLAPCPKKWKTAKCL